MKNKMKILLLFMAMLIICPSLDTQAKDVATVYDTYIYGNDATEGDGKPIKIPDVYSVEQVYIGEDLGVGSFREMSDVFYDKNGKIYIADSGNNRICIFDENLKVIGQIKEFENQGQMDSFSAPRGVFVNEEILLVCDSLNARILMFSAKDYSLQKVFLQPKIEALNDSSGHYNYVPEKAVMDRAGRLYVVADGINQGIIRLDQDGSFISFIGAPNVVPDLSEQLWRKIATKEQRKRMTLYVPTEYDSLLIDEDGFLYATSCTSETEAFVRLNSNGDNILASIDFFGDSSMSTYNKEVKPYFVDIAVDKEENSYLLDAQQGKIYIYNKDGQMVCAFGGNSIQKGSFQSASAIEVYDNQLMVVDRNKNTLTVFELTEFGSTIYEANALFNQGENEKAREAFLEVQKMCSSYIPAIVSISFIDIQNGKYTQALDQLKQIRNHSDYTVVYRDIRNEIIREYFPMMLLGGLILIVIIFLLKKWMSKSVIIGRIKNADLYQKYKYSSHTMFHPFDGFWDIKHENRGNIKSATLILIMFIILYGIRAQFSGYVVTKTISSDVNGLFSVAMILLPLALAILANWCLTTFMEGKGKMKDIYIVVCYSLKPYVTFAIPLFLMSHLLAGEEAMFYTVFDTVVTIWMLGLIFFGWMTVHDYSLSKGVISAIGTIIGICLMIFMILLAMSVVQNVMDFIMDLYREITLRIYS